MLVQIKDCSGIAEQVRGYVVDATEDDRGFFHFECFGSKWIASKWAIAGKVVEITIED